MAFTITHRTGEMESDPQSGWEERLLAELADADQEHADVTVSHESGWSLSAFRTGRIIWQNVEGDDAAKSSTAYLRPRQVAEAFRLVASGRIDEVRLLIAAQNSDSTT